MGIGSENAGKDVLRAESVSGGVGVVPGMPLDQAEPVVSEPRRRSARDDDNDRPRVGVVPGMLDDEEEEEERERSWAGVVPEAMDGAAEENARFMSTGAAGMGYGGSGVGGSGSNASSAAGGGYVSDPTANFGKPGLKMGNNKLQLAANDTMGIGMGMDDAAEEAADPQEVWDTLAKIGKLLEPWGQAAKNAWETVKGVLEPKDTAAESAISGDDAIKTENGYVQNDDYGMDDKELISQGEGIIDNIFQYYLDKANSNMPLSDFQAKYPDEEYILNTWEKQLAGIIGEEACDKFMSGVSQIDIGKEKQGEKVDEIKQDEAVEDQDSLGEFEKFETVTIHGKDGYDYTIDKPLNQDVNEQAIDEVVSITLNQPGGWTEVFKEGIQNGEAVVQIRNYNELELDDNAVKAMYGKEQKRRNELAIDYINLGLIARDPKLAISWLAGKGAKAIFSNEDSSDGTDSNEYFSPEDYAGSAAESVSEEIIEGHPSVKGVLKGTTQNLLEEKALELFSNLIDQFHDGDKEIAGGNYVETEVLFCKNNNSGPSMIISNMRLVEQDGSYVYDPNDILCYVITEPAE